MDEATRRRASEMTDDLSIWEGPPVAMAVVLLSYMARVAVLEKEASGDNSAMLSIVMAQPERREGRLGEWADRFGLIDFFPSGRVAFWVALGLPVTFFGAFWLMGDHVTGMTLNILTTFGFIILSSFFKAAGISKD